MSDPKSIQVDLSIRVTVEDVNRLRDATVGEAYAEGDRTPAPFVHPGPDEALVLNYFTDAVQKAALADPETFKTWSAGGRVVLVEDPLE